MFSIQCIVCWRKSYGAYTGNSSPAHNPPEPFPDNNLGLFEVLKTLKTLPRQQSWSFSSSQNPQNTYQKTVLVFLKFSKLSRTNKCLLKLIFREDCQQEYIIKLDDDDGNHQLTTCSLHQYCSWPPAPSQRAWCQGTSDQTRACLHFLISPGSVFCRFCL